MSAGDEVLGWRRGGLSRPTRSILLLLSVLTGLTSAACSTDDPCPFEVDALLDVAGADSAERTDCSSYNSADSRIQEGVSCLFDAIAAGSTAELSVNRCIDCLIEFNYVATAGGVLYEVYRESDHYGDDTRNVRVRACDHFERDSTGVVCVSTQTLFECSDHEL